MQKFCYIKIFVIHENLCLLLILQIRIIIHLNNIFKIEGFDNRLQKLNQYSLYHIKISNRRQFSRRSLRSQSYKHEKNSKVTIYSFHAHKHFWKMRYKQHRVVLVRFQNRQYKIELWAVSTKLQSDFIQRINFFIMLSIARSTLSIFILIIQYFKFFQWFIMSERSLHKRRILILLKFNFIFWSINRVGFNCIYAALNKFIKFLFQVLCISCKVRKLTFFQLSIKII